MAHPRFRLVLMATAVVVILLAAIAVALLLPGAGAGALLHPMRRAVATPAPAACDTVVFAGDGVLLNGWHCRPSGPRRGALVYLHGIADNHNSAAGTIERFATKGLEVIAYDSRAHGDSTGGACTYGFFEKRDLKRVLDTLPPGPVVLLGASLGAAVALQEAADDPRVTAVVAAETFSDLRTVAIERAPVFFTTPTIERAFRLAERQAGFEVDAVSPVTAARRITVPALLIHGAADVDTPAGHSQRVFDALAGPKRLILVPGAGHKESLRPAIWLEIEQWIEAALPRAG